MTTLICDFFEGGGTKKKKYTVFAAITSKFHFQVVAELDAAVKRLDQSEGGKTAMVEQVLYATMQITAKE